MLPALPKLWKSFEIRSSKQAFPKIGEGGLQLQATAVDEDEKGGLRNQIVLFLCSRNTVIPKSRTIFEDYTSI